MPVLTTSLRAKKLCEKWAIQSHARTSGPFRDGMALLNGGVLPLRGTALEDVRAEQRFTLRLRSHPSASRTLIRCSVDVGRWDIDDDEQAERLSDLQAHLGLPRICAQRDAGRQEEVVTLASDLLFDPQTTQLEEIEWLVRRAVERADAIRSGMRDRDSKLPALVRLTPSELDVRIDRLVARRRLDWARDGDTLTVGLWGNGRNQKVEIRRRAEICRI